MREEGSGPHATRLCVIVNAGSGSQGTERVERISRAVAAHPWNRWRVMVPGQPGQLVQTAREAIAEGADTIVACGGDGTVSTIAAVVAGSGARLGVVPQGTFNFFARGLGIPDDIDAAVAVIAAGHGRLTPVGEVNGQIFLNNASLGVYPAILRQRESIYRRWGRSRLAAHWSMLKAMAMFRRPLGLTIEADGQVHHRRTPLAFVANSAYQLDLLGIDAADEIRAGRLVLLLAPEDRPAAMMARALKLGARLASEDRDYEVMSAGAFRLHTHKRSQTVARDGERDVMAGPFDIRLRPDALLVIVPGAAG